MSKINVRRVVVKMKKRKILSNKVIIGIIITIIILLSLNLEIKTATTNCDNHQSNNYQWRKISNPSVEKSFSYDLTPHGPIEIISDDDFNSYSFPGNGSESNPFIIENYEIITSNGKGISITGTTKYFVIRNCYLDAVDWGLYVYGVAEGTATIMNNILENNIYGMSLWHSTGYVVINNTCRYNTEYGIQLDTSHESAVINNTCSFNNAYGVYQWNSTNSFFTNNICIDNQMRGIYLQDTNSAVLTNNTCTNNNEYGIYLLDSSGTTLTNNTCTNNNYGIYQYRSDSTLINNTCNYNMVGIVLFSSSGSTIAIAD